MGEHHPAGTNKARSRRVEIVVIKTGAARPAAPRVTTPPGVPEL